MMRNIQSKFLIVLGLLFLGVVTIAAQSVEMRFKVHGQLIDARTKKGIKKIPFTVVDYKRNVEADAKGAFLYNMPAGSHTFLIDYYPFDKKEVTFNLQSDTTLVIELQSPFASRYIEEVEVFAKRLASEQSSSLKLLDSHALKTLPAMIGERDVLKALAMTAGVTSSSEGAADMQVRGGLHGQNLYLLDGIPLYSTQHFFGMISAYNPIIIRSARLYKADFPAEFGGKVSSVVNVLTEDANLKKFSGAAEISLLSSKALLNIPLVKDKLALSVSGRLSNYSLINMVSLFSKGIDDTKIALHFADVNANLLWKLSNKDKLKLTLFRNSDGIDGSQSDVYSNTAIWIDNKQQNGGLNWYHSFSESSDNHLLAYADNYSFDYGTAIRGIKTTYNQAKQILTGIKSYGLDDKLRTRISDKLNLTSGGSFKYYSFSPVQVNQTDSSTTRIRTSTQMKQTEAVLFAETNYQFTEKQHLTTGLRLNIMGNDQKLYKSIEPRVGYQGLFANDFSVSVSIGRMSQAVHRVANPGLGVPFEIFLPSTASLRPETSWNYSLGAAKDYSWGKSKFSVKADAWYKSMKDIVEFKEGYDVLTSMLYKIGVTEGADNIVTQGNGKAYGIDFSTEYSQKNWSLTADYTLMQARNKFEELNYGQSFAASTDIRHSLTITSEVKLSATWLFSASWQYRSGKPITMPTYVFAYPTPNAATGELDTSNPSLQVVETARNNYRTKPFHKLDVSFTHNYIAFKKYNASISLGVYNVYNQYNPYLYYITTQKNASGNNIPILNSMAIFSIIPSFNWSVKF